MKCDCGSRLVPSRNKDKDFATLYYCHYCNYLFYFDHKCEGLVRIGDREENIPSIVEGSKVIVSNVQHKLFLETGVVIKRSHMFYRIQFDNLNDLIWVNVNWVGVLPKELCS